MSTKLGPNPYLKTKVMTARPEQLRQMLLEGAVKFCRQGRAALGRKDYEGMFNGLSRAQKIILELLSCLRHDVHPQLCSRLSALYEYMYRRLIDANLERDTAPIDEVIRLLDFESETWRLALEKMMNEDGDPADPAQAFSAYTSSGPLATIGPKTDPPNDKSRTSFSAEG